MTPHIAETSRTGALRRSDSSASLWGRPHELSAESIASSLASGPSPLPSSLSPASGLRPAAVPTASRSSASGSPALSVLRRRRARRSNHASGPRNPPAGKPAATIHPRRVGAAGATIAAQRIPASAPPSLVASSAGTVMRSTRPALARRPERPSRASTIAIGSQAAIRLCPPSGPSVLGERLRRGRSSAPASRPRTIAAAAKTDTAVTLPGTRDGGSGRIRRAAGNQPRSTLRRKRAPRRLARRIPVAGAPRREPRRPAGRRPAAR